MKPVEVNDDKEERLIHIPKISRVSDWGRKKERTGCKEVTTRAADSEVAVVMSKPCVAQGLGTAE